MTSEFMGRYGINLEEVFCPSCNERLPKLRVPDSLQQLMWGGWTCPKCGSRMDKWGKPISMPQGQEEA